MEMSSNFTLDSCRVCMARSSNMSYLFDRNKVFILDNIEYCTGLSMKDEEGLPTNICELCLKNLATAYKFKTTCLLADNTFRNILNANIKIESIDENNPDINHDESRIEDYGDVADSDNTKNKANWIYNNEREKETEDSEVVTPRSEACENPPNAKKSRVQKGRPLKMKKLKGNQQKVPKKRHKIDPLVCQICDVKFENKEQVVTHRKAKHKNTDCWLCEICGKAFIYRGSHYLHVKSHFPPEFACDHCDYKTWQKHDLAKHLRRHEGIRLYQCELCNASFYSVSNLTNHIRRIHKNEKRYSCDICQKMFYDRTKLNMHVDTHNDIKRFECKVCHTCFTRRCYLKKHLLSKHKIISPPMRPGRQKTNYFTSN